MSSVPSSPEYGSQSDSDFDVPMKKKQKTSAAAAAARTDDTAPGGRTGMTLRDATKRRRPGRYRETDDIPDTKPAWVHPVVPFNPDLVKFVESYSLPIDSPPGFPSRDRYNAHLEKTRAEEERRKEAEQQGVGHVSVEVRAEVQDGTSAGPRVVHLPPLREPRHGQEPYPAHKEDETLLWIDLSKRTQWVLIDYKNNQLQSRGENLGLSDAFHSLNLRLRDIIEFVELYNKDLSLYKQWVAQIKATEPVLNDLEFYRTAWGKSNLTTFHTSAEDIRQGQEYLRQLGEHNVEHLNAWQGQRSYFFHIADMEDLDVAYLRETARRGVDTNYGDLTRESIDWVAKNILEAVANEVEQQEVGKVQSHSSQSLDQQAKPMDLDGAVPDDEEEVVELQPSFDPSLGGVLLDPYYLFQYPPVPQHPVGMPQEILQPIGGDGIGYPALPPGDSHALDTVVEQSFPQFGGPLLAGLPVPLPEGSDLAQGNENLGWVQRDLGLDPAFNPSLNAGIPPLPGGLAMPLGEDAFGLEAGYDIYSFLGDAIPVPEVPAGPDVNVEPESPQSPQDSGLFLRRANRTHDGRVDSIYHGMQNVTGFPPPLPATYGGQVGNPIYQGTQNVSDFQTPVSGWYGGSSPASDRSYRRRVREFEEEIRDTRVSNGVAVHQENNGRGPGAVSPAADFRFDEEWYAALQPVVHSVWSGPFLLWKDDPAWRRVNGLDQNEDDDAALFEPSLRDAHTGNDMISGHHQSQMTQVNDSNTGAAPVVGSKRGYAIVLSPVPEAAEEVTPTQGQNSRENPATAATGSASKGSVRLSLVEKPNGQAVLQQAAVTGTNHSASPRRVSNKRTLDEFIEDDNDPAVKTPARPRGRAHRKDTVALESDDDFKGVSVPVCESNDEDYNPKRVKTVRKRKNSGAASKGKKASAAPRNKKKTADEASQEQKPAQAPKEKKAADAPKRKYVKRKKADANNNGAPSSMPVSATAMPAVAGPLSAVPTPALSWLHMAFSGNDAGLNNFESLVASGFPPEAAGFDSAAMLPTPPVSADWKAMLNEGFGGCGLPSDGTAPATAAAGAAIYAGEGQALGSQAPSLKPKSTRRTKKDQEDKTVEKPKPKRARAKKTDAASNKGNVVAPPVCRKETPVPLPPMPMFPSAQQGGSHGGNHNAQINPQASSDSKAGPKTGSKPVSKLAPKPDPKNGTEAGFKPTHKAKPKRPESRIPGKDRSELRQKGTYRNPMSAEEFASMSSRGELLTLGQPHQAGGAVPFTYGLTPGQMTGQQISMVPALDGRPIIPQHYYPRPEPLSLADAFTGVYGPSRPMCSMTPATPSPEKPAKMFVPAATATLSPTKTSSKASGGRSNENAIAGNILEAQEKINRGMTFADQLVAPRTVAQPSVPQTEKSFASVQGNDGVPMQKQVKPIAPKPKPKPARKNTIDSKTGKPRVGRPRTRNPQDVSTNSSQQMDIASNDVGDQGVQTSAGEAQ